MTVPVNRTLALLCAPLLAFGVSGCASTTTTAGFKGEAHEVAQTVANLQSDASARDEGKICKADLASAVVSRLNSIRGGCVEAIKNQLSEVDSFEASVESVRVNGTGAAATATAQVKGIYNGKARLSTLSLVKEDGKWKISGPG